jgi:hypothetical protein
MSKFSKSFYLGSTGSAVSRLSYPGRFSVEDQILVDLLESYDLTDIFDIGVSSGVTTAELCKKLNLSTQPSVKVFACDVFSKLTRESYPLFDVYKTYDGRVAYFQISYFRFSKNFSKKRFLQRLIASLVMFIYKQSSTKMGEEVAYFQDSFSELINNGLVIWVDHDFFSSRTNIFRQHVGEKKVLFRIFNVLNLDLFERNRIKAFLRNVLLSMPEGSRLWIGRTDKLGITNSTIFLREAGRLKLDRKFNTGSELTSLISELELAP